MREEKFVTRFMSRAKVMGGDSGQRKARAGARAFCVTV